MGNKVIYMVLAGVFTFVWWWTGYNDHYATEAGGISPGYWFWAILTVAMGAGQAGGEDNPVNAIVNALKGCIPMLISFFAAGLVVNLMYQFLIKDGGFEISGVINTFSTIGASSILMVLVLTAFRRAQ
jgi:hypothetical protein